MTEQIDTTEIQDTYLAPKNGWTCFHCGETFVAEGKARDHFGPTPDCKPACIVGYEVGVVMAMREAEKEAALAWCKLHDETSDFARAHHAQASRHSTQLRVVEQAGYEKGLADGKAMHTIRTYQAEVDEWMDSTFGDKASAKYPDERANRFLEEALELYQACGGNMDGAKDLTDYVFGRGIGWIDQEIGGVSVTLAALCNALPVDWEDAAHRELKRCWENQEKIKAKDANKPMQGVLPGPTQK